HPSYCRTPCSHERALPPRSLLFPYTTLFRSGLHVGAGDGDRAPVLEPRLEPARRHLERGGALGVPHQQIRHAEGEVIHRPGRVGDRKSTRLNSSHQIISYAVFCLKKKIIENK